MLSLLQKLRQKVAIGTVGGSDLAKQHEQIGPNVTELFDYVFAENGLTAYRCGQKLSSNSFIQWLGETKYQALANFILHYIADLDIPVKRGTFIEFRNGMINVSPIGRNASVEERNEFERFEKTAGVRMKLVEELREKFGDYGLTYSIGGQISFDAFPADWDKTYCLQHVEKEFGIVHFYGDKTYLGGNDYEIYTDVRTVGHSVKNPADTMEQLKMLFDL